MLPPSSRTMRSVVPRLAEPIDPELFRVIIREVLGDREEVSCSDVRKYCIARLYRAGPVLVDALEVLTWARVIAVTESTVKRGPQFDAVQGSDTQADWLRLAGLIIARLDEDDAVSSVFGARSFAWDRSGGTLLLLAWRVPLAHFGLIVLLKALGAIAETGGGQDILAIDSSISGLLIDSLGRSAKRAPKAPKALSPEQLAQLKRDQELQGAVAEEFVLAVERKRLSGHPQLELVRRVSLEDVTHGYDILSFESLSSIVPDRYIEVKSYQGHEHFYLSNGELEAARYFGNAYYLYIVDASQVNREDYQPRVVQDPSVLLFGEQMEWHMTATEWYVYRAPKTAATARQPSGC